MAFLRKYDWCEVVRLYLAGYTHAQIEDQLGVPSSQTSNILKRSGVPVRPRARVSREEAVRLYQEGSTVKDISVLLGASTSHIYEILRKEGTPARKWKFDQRFFHVIDTEEKAYWLGFIVADGCVSGGKVAIGIASRDADHLDSFQRAVGMEKTLTSRKQTGLLPGGAASKTDRWLVTSTLCSKLMVADLRRLGIVERKSMREVAPVDDIPTTLQRHFWRGVVDGDGSIGQTSSRDVTPGPQVSLVGSEELCCQFLDFARRYFPLSRVSVRPTNKIFRVRFGKRTEAHGLLALLYGDASVSLSRKQALAQAWGYVPRYSTTPPAGAHLTYGKAEEIRQKARSGEHRADLAKEYGVRKQTIASVLSGRTYHTPVELMDRGKHVR